MELHKIWIEQCEAAKGIEDEFGTQKALEYLVGEKFLNFLEAAETDTDFRAEIPAFDAEEVEEMRKDDIRQCTRDLLLVERAREWLLDE